MVSEKFKAAIKLHSLKAYQIAHKAGLHPSTLSKILNGIERVAPNDPRVLRVAKVLGLMLEECFDFAEEHANAREKL